MITPEIQSIINQKVNTLFFRVGIFWFIIILIVIGATFFISKKIIYLSTEKILEKLKSDIRVEEIIKQKRWEMKRSVCLKALNVANAVLSHYTYEKAKDAYIVKTEMTTEEIRQCYNELATICETPFVLDELKKIMVGNVSLDAIVDLRTAVRKELGFGNTIVDMDRAKAFLASAICDPARKKFDEAKRK